MNKLLNGIVGGMALAVVCVCGLIRWDQVQPKPAKETAHVARKPATREEVLASITPRLEKADRDSAAALAKALAHVNDYITERKRGAKPFAEAVLGFEGKTRAADDQINRAISYISGFFKSDDDPPPGLFGIALREEDNLTGFVTKQFDELVLEQSQLQKVVQSAIAGYVDEVQAIEYRLLVDIRADLDDGDALAQALPELRSEALLQDRYEALLRDVVGTSSTDLDVSIAREAISWVGSDIAQAATLRIAQAIAVELGISGGVLSVGAGSTVATLGIGWAVSWVVDLLIKEILKLAGYDAEGEIAAKVEGALEQTRNLVMGGSSDGAGRGGLQAELHRLHDGRARLRTAAIKKLILEGGAL